MIPRRVFHPKIISHRDENPKGASISNTSSSSSNSSSSRLDWDSPSSYTGTVKRRPSSSSSIETVTSPTITETTTPIITLTDKTLRNFSHHSFGNVNNPNPNSIDDDHRHHQQREQQQHRLHHKINNYEYVDISPQEIEQGNYFAKEEKDRKRENVGKINNKPNQVEKRQIGYKFTTKNIVDDSSIFHKEKSKLKLVPNDKSSIISNKKVSFTIGSNSNSKQQQQQQQQHQLKNNNKITEPVRFTELFRDPPINSASSQTTLERIPLKSSSYRNPPGTRTFAPTDANGKQKESKKVKIEKNTELNKRKCFNNNNNSNSKHHLPDEAKDIKSYWREKFITSNPKFGFGIKENISKEYTFKEDDFDKNGIRSYEIVTQNFSIKIEKKIDREQILNDYAVFDTHKFRTINKMEVNRIVPNGNADDNGEAKAKYSSSLFENIPVRARKGTVQHMENYCLFDPSVDFINEKEQANNKKEEPSEDGLDDDELIEEIIYEENVIGDENGSGNYFEIDPQALSNEIDENSPSSSSSPPSTLVLLDKTAEIMMPISNKPPPLPLSAHETDRLLLNQRTEIIDDIKEKSVPKSISGSLKNYHNNNDSGEFLKVPSITSLLKKAPQIDKIFRQSSLPMPSGSSVRRSLMTNQTFPSTAINYSSSTSSSSSVLASSHQMNKHKKLLTVDATVTATNNNGLSGRIQHKPRYGRPLSSHSDADSGFLSPLTPDEPRFESSVVVLDQCDSVQGFIEIYTDWANYYLERAKSKKKVLDLSADCRDGLLLAEVIEAVMAFKVPDLIKKPKTQQQMYDNVNACLNTLRLHSVTGLENITANDISSGRLKAVLSLFFALSRYKQATKQKSVGLSAKQQQQPQSQQQQHQQLQQQQQQQQHQMQIVSDVNAGGNTTMTNRQLPVPHVKAGVNGGTAIPLPATVSVTRRCPPDKVRPLPPTPGQQSVISGLMKKSFTPSEGNSRPESPLVSESQIPKGSSGYRQSHPTCKSLASPYSSQNCVISIGNGSTTNVQNEGTQKQSMLEKLFNREKSERSKTLISKRTSSSSGFSSAKSERSDSSLSLNDGQGPVKNLDKTKKNDSQNIKSSSKMKFLSTSKHTTKDVNSTKGTSKSDKKDKSPARKEINEAQEMLSESKMAPTKLQRISSSSKQDLKMRSSSNIRKLEVRSDSKTNLSNMQLSTKSMPVPNTSIPKPMAAIKGTSKPSPMDKSLKPDDTSPDVQNKLDKINDISSTVTMQQHLTSGKLACNDQKMQIVNPLAQMSTTMMEPQRGDIICGNTSQLPFLHPTAASSINISMTDSTNSNSTHSASTGLHSNSSESSVIYRPSSESGSDVFHSRGGNFNSPPVKNIIPNRKIDSFLNDTPPSSSSPSQLAITGDNGKSMITNNSSSNFDDEKQITVLPMRPLLRGYNSHVTLPTRGIRGHRQHLVQDYCDDMGQGYCSDGDALKKITTKYSDIDNGYLSEGGMAGKHFMSVLRQRPVLPTTIEERSRGSRSDQLDSLESANGSFGARSNASNINNNNNNNNSRDHWSKLTPQHQPPTHLNGFSSHQTSLSPTSGRRDKNSPIHSRRNQSSSKSNNSSSGRTKGVPQSFGYIKRTNGTIMTGNMTMDSQLQHQQQMGMNFNGQNQGDRTAHVSAVPRAAKMKVSGGTQTCSSDLQSRIVQSPQQKSYSLTGPGAAQLSQSIRERQTTGTHSLPKPGTELHLFQHRMANRASGGKLTDGSLSDTQTYAEVKMDYNNYSLWLKHSTATNSRLSEGDSMESLQIGPSGTPRNHKLLQRDLTYSNSPRLNRSNSIRSTKSEKTYPTMLSRGPDVDIDPYYCLPVGTLQPPGAVAWSQPTSPTPPNRTFGGLNGGPLSPTLVNHRLTYQKKNDDTHGSSASLLSGRFSFYGASEERQSNEVRRLRREIIEAREQVVSLSSQLSTNAHVVSAFEQSLANMTQRLHHLTATVDRKDSELNEMKETIEMLRKQSIKVTQAPGQNMAVQANFQSPKGSESSDAMQRHHSSDSMCSLNSISSGCSTQEKKKKKEWLRSSFTKAFSRNAKISKTREHGTNSQQVPMESVSENGVPPPPSPMKSPIKTVTMIENAKPIDALFELEGNPIVEDLKKQLREKDLVLTDIRLEALSSASQLENLKDTVIKMRSEMINLKQNNERMQKLITCRSLASSEASIGRSGSPNGSLTEPRRYSLADGTNRPRLELPESLEEADEDSIPPAPAPDQPRPMSQTSHVDLSPPLSPTSKRLISSPDKEDHKIKIPIYMNQDMSEENQQSFHKYEEESFDSDY